MEKFTQWRDKATGIHPFLIKNQQKPLALFLRNPIFFFIKLPFIVFLTIVLLMTNYILNFIPLDLIRRYSQLIIEGIICRMLLFLLGFHKISTHWVRLFMNHKLPKTTPGEQIYSGDLIICNKTSYVEILYLHFRYHPVFTALPSSKPDTFPPGVTCKRTLVQALKDCFIIPDISAKDCEYIEDIMKDAKLKKRGPVVLFPEITTSNGKGLLRHYSSSSSTSCFGTTNISKKDIHILGFKYEWSRFCPSFVYGKVYFHLYNLIGQSYNKMVVRYLSPFDIPESPNDAKFNKKETNEELNEEEEIEEEYDDDEEEEEEEEEEDMYDEHAEWGNDIIKKLVNTLRIKQTSLTVQDKREFIDFVKNYNTKKFKKKSH